jgi:hypothetical protein
MITLVFGYGSILKDHRPCLVKTNQGFSKIDFDLKCHPNSANVLEQTRSLRVFPKSTLASNVIPSEARDLVAPFINYLIPTVASLRSA